MNNPMGNEIKMGWSIIKEERLTSISYRSLGWLTDLQFSSTKGPGIWRNNVTILSFCRAAHPEVPCVQVTALNTTLRVTRIRSLLPKEND